MSDPRHSEIPVLIVGAGAAGLTAAVALARRGIACLLVERRRDLSALPRATAISTRSMELLRAWGLEDDVRAGGTEVEWLMWVCETLASAADGSGQRVGFPTREQSAMVSPTTPACVPQDHLESVLLRHLRSLSAARVRFGTELVSVDDRPEGVQALLHEVASGEPRIVHARYLVAADGAHSTVRDALDIPMRGPDGLAAAVSALFRAPLWKVVGDRRYGLYDINHPEAAGIFLPAGGGDRWLYGHVLKPGRDQSADLDEERLARRIRLGAGVPALEPQIERIGSFSFAAQLAQRFRRGNAFLVGDAAHRVTPRGATGMNTAIHDGHDLGWKLAWVLRGWAPPQLLDSYEAERRPVAEHNVARSADPDGSLREAERELRVDLGGRITHVWLPCATRRISTIDMLGSGLTLFTGPQRARWERAAACVAGPLPLVVRSLDAITARAIGIDGGGALLARPDGSPAGYLPHGSAAPELRAAVRSFLAGSGRREADRMVAVS